MSERAVVRKLFERLAGSQRLPFPKPRSRLDAPDQHGVYIIFSPQDKVLHVGRTPRGRKGIRQRLGNHLHNASSFTNQYLKGRGARLRKGHKFCYLVVPEPRLRALLEAYAIGVLCPAHLGLGQLAT